MKFKNIAEYRKSAHKGNDSWYKLLPQSDKKRFISDCLSEFIVQTSQKEVVYSYEIMRLFYREMGVKPSADYTAKVFEHKFNVQSIKVEWTSGTFGEPDFYFKTRQAYFGFILKPEIDLYKLSEIKRKYTDPIDMPNLNCLR